MSMNTRGGRREGAGRKKIENPRNKTITLHVRPETHDAIREEARRRGTTIAQMIEDIFIVKAAR